MKTIRVLPDTPINTHDFCLKYGEKDILISKFRLAMYSKRFRESKEFDNCERMVVMDFYQPGVFESFIEAAQGNKFEINNENALDFMKLSNIWDVESISAICSDYIKKNIGMESLIGEISNNSENWVNVVKSLEDTIVDNINMAIRVSSFINVPLDVLKSIFISPKLRIQDHHSLCTFLLKVIDIHGKEASQLFNVLDLCQLTSQEAIQVLQNPLIEKRYLAESACLISLALLKETDILKSNLDQIKKRIDNIEEYRFEEEFQRIDNTFVDIRKRIDDNIPKADSISQINTELIEKNLESKLSVIAEGVATKINELSNRIKKNDKTVSISIKDSIQKINAIEDSLDPIKSETFDMGRMIRSINERQKVLERSLSKEMSLPPESINIPFGGHSFDGIFAYFIKENEEKSIIVTSSSAERGHPSLVIAKNPKDYFLSENKPNQWICFDFTIYTVLIMNYSLRTLSNVNNSPNPKSWVIEASNNGNEWTKIDKRITSLLNGPDKYQTFPVTCVEGNFRYVRFRQTDLNFKGDNRLGLSAIEIFGLVTKTTE